MILSWLEAREDANKLKVTVKLDQLYHQLVDLYLTIEQPVQCEQIIQTLEDRLEKSSNEDDYAFSIMNELANLLRKHDNLELASQFYKKALLCIKRRYKTDYLNHESTSKVLINIATVSYLLQNIPEALKYYNHAIEILGKISGSQRALSNPS